MTYTLHNHYFSATTRFFVLGLVRVFFGSARKLARVYPLSPPSHISPLPKPLHHFSIPPLVLHQQFSNTASQTPHACFVIKIRVKKFSVKKFSVKKFSVKNFSVKKLIKLALKNFSVNRWTPENELLAGHRKAIQRVLLQTYINGTYSLPFPSLPNHEIL